jgi:hypothetical protein
VALTWRGDEAIRRMREGAAIGLTRAARALAAESDARVPVDSTDLRRSRGVHEATPDSLISAVTYNTPYAVIQHERLDFNHPQTHNPGAQAKFLERPAMELHDKLMGVVAAEIRRATNS